jgi:preprotein translocase subunit SecG
MELLASILNVVVIIASILLVLMVLVQTSKNDMGLFQSTSQSVFGSRSGDVLTKTTSILAAIFLLGSFALAYLKVNIYQQQKVSEEQLKQGTEQTPQTGQQPKTGNQSGQKPKGQKATKPSDKPATTPANNQNQPGN